MKFELPHDDSKLGSTPNGDAVIPAEQLEIKNKMLRLYEKAILASDFETADTLNTEVVPNEELKQVRIKTLAFLAGEIEKYNEGHYTSLQAIEQQFTKIQQGLHIGVEDVQKTKESVVTNYITKCVDRMFYGRGQFSNWGNPPTYFEEIKEWGEKTGLTKEDIKKIVNDGYLRFQKSEFLSLKSSYDYVAREKHFNSTPEKEKAKIQKREDEELPGEIEEKLKKVLEASDLGYSKKELQNLKEEGFLAFLEAEGVHAYSSKDSIKRALKISKLSEDVLHSKHIEVITVKKARDFVEGISFEKDAKSDAYPVDRNDKLFNNIKYIANSDLFPKHLKNYPEIQEIVDDKFKEFAAQLGIDKGEFVPSNYLIAEANRYGKSPEGALEVKKCYSYIEKLSNLAKLTKVSADAITATDFKPLAEKYIEAYFADPRLDLQYEFKLGTDELEKAGIASEELDMKAEESFLAILKASDPESIRKISDINRHFNLSEKFKKSGAVIESEVSFLEKLIKTTNTRATAAFLEEIDLPQSALDSEYFIELKQIIINKALSAGLTSTSDIRVISEKLDFSNCKEFLKGEEVREKINSMFDSQVKEVITDMIGYTTRYQIECFKIKDGKLIHDAEGKDKGMDGYKYRADEKVQKFISAYNFAASLENKELIRDLFLKLIKQQSMAYKRIVAMDSVFKGADRYGVFDISKEDVKSVIVDSLIELMGVGSYSVMERTRSIQNDREVSKDYLFVPTLDLIERFSKEFELNKEQTRRLALKSVEYLLTDEKNIREDGAKEIFDKYRITSAEVRDIVKDLYLSYIAKGTYWAERALKLKKAFNLEIDSSELDKTMQAAFLISLKKGETSNLDKQIESLPSEFLKSTEVQTIGRGLFLSLLSKNQEQEARRIKTSLRLEITVAEIIAENSAAKKFIEAIQEKFPSLAKKYLNSVDAFISIYSQIGNEKIFSTLEAHPFLAEALSNNEQYGLKLIFKFDSLDKLSKTNIETIYAARKSILEQRPDIDIDSRDFRIAMQTYLEPYRRNGKILETLADAGINVEEWLNHEEEIYFELGRDKPMTFSEALITPIERMEETINNYIKVNKEVIVEYKSELAAFKVPLKNVEEIEKELAELELQRDKALGAGNQKKADGISKGIDNLKGQLESKKTTSVWDKLSSNLALVDLAKQDAFKAYKTLKDAELKSQEKEQDTSIPVAQKRKELLNLKSQIEAAKKELREKINLLDKRMTEDSDYRLNGLEKALGEDRSIALMQERNERLGEAFDHYYSDNKAIMEVFSEKKEKGLDGQPMKIGIWNRNPDVDLYLGNYTDCCIRIDSEHMGEECTIADYLTDVGIQIVNVYDEKKGIPVATAWCWMGHDDDDKVSFVVDNIEANTAYSSVYKAQLEEKLKAYIENYAAKVGANLVQGSKNNDLTIARMDSSYFKLGGYNRASGYYLEGEDEHHYAGQEDHEQEHWGGDDEN